MRITPSVVLKPSISTRSWLRVCSRSSCPPPMPAPRWRPTASNSSRKMMQGARCRPVSNRSRTLDAPTPTNISTKSEPLMVKKGTFASPATALARSVFPVPGRPTRSTPLGILPPSFVNFLASCKKSIISSRSCLASSQPATSSNVFFVLSSECRRALLLPNAKALFPVPCICLEIKYMKPMRSNSGSKPPAKKPNHSGNRDGSG